MTVIVPMTVAMTVTDAKTSNVEYLELLIKKVRVWHSNSRHGHTV
jgi:hypothetical protein